MTSHLGRNLSTNRRQIRRSMPSAIDNRSKAATELRGPQGFLPAARAGRLPEVCESTLYRAIRLRTIPAVKVHGRWFVSAAALGCVSGMSLTAEPPGEEGAS
jgi:hypothetical protein